MSSLLESVAIPALRETPFSFWLSETGDSVVVPLPLPGTVPQVGGLLLSLQPDEESQLIDLVVELVVVPTARWSDVALLVGRLNRRFRFVTVSFKDGVVVADCCADLRWTNEPQARFLARLQCLLRVVRQMLPEVVAAAYPPKGKPPKGNQTNTTRVEQEINDIMNRLEGS